ncbi:MAG: hypothetical protein OHK0052_21020 [Anaerolineales bacterium]
MTPLEMRRLSYLLLPLIGLLLWLAVRDLNWREIVHSLRRLTPLQLLLLAALNLLILLLNSARWQILLRAQGWRVPLQTVFGYRLAAFGVNYFTPGPQFGGEPLQVRLLQTRHHLPLPQALAAVSLDKLLELLVNFTFLALGLIGIALSGLNPAQANLPLLPPILGLLALPGGYLLLLTRAALPLTTLAQRWLIPARSARLQNLGRILISSERSAAGLCTHAPRQVAAALLVSLLGWGLLILEYALTLRFLGAPLDALEIIAALTAARLAFLAPTPGGLGALEASQVWALGALGVNPAIGLGAALLIRARDLLLGGLGLLWGARLLREKKSQ